MKTRYTLCYGRLSIPSLNKEMIQIPYYIRNNFGYKTKIYHIKQGLKEVYKNSSLPDNYNFNGIEIKLLKEFKIGFISLNIIFFIIKNAKKIDILNLIHFIKPNLVYGFLYKFLNPKGKLYIKMDFDARSHDKKTLFKTKYNFFNKIVYKIVNNFIKKCDVISVETNLAYKMLIEYNPTFKDKLIYMPNGFDAEGFQKIVPNIKTFEEKENIIITVGRIGTHQKNNEMLLEAIKNIDLKDWKVYIIGPIEDKFQDYINNFFDQNPKLKDKVIFTGAIYDKEKLYNFYNRAKIFCMTSRYEEFSIAMLESLFFGNLMITTDVGCIDEITHNGKYGYIIPNEDSKELSKKLQELIDNPDLLKQKMTGIHEFAIQNFDWAKLVKKIIDKLFKINI